MDSNNLETLKAKLTPAAQIRERCQKSREQIIAEAGAKVKEFVDTVLEPTLKYIDGLVRASADLAPNDDYMLIMHESVFKSWNIEIDKQIIDACNDANGTGYCAKLTSIVTEQNFPVKIVNIVLDLLRPVLEAQGYRLQLCMRYGGSREHDCFDIIWGKDE
jgi:hypothetical protein